MTIHDDVNVYYDTPVVGRAAPRQERDEPAEKAPQAGLGVAHARNQGGNIYPGLAEQQRSQAATTNPQR